MSIARWLCRMTTIRQLITAIQAADPTDDATIFSLLAELNMSINIVVYRRKNNDRHTAILYDNLKRGCHEILCRRGRNITFGIPLSYKDVRQWHELSTDEDYMHDFVDTEVPREEIGW